MSHSERISLDYSPVKEDIDNFIDYELPKIMESYSPEIIRKMYIRNFLEDLYYCGYIAGSSKK